MKDFPLEHCINNLKEEIINDFQSKKEARTIQGALEIGFALYVLERVLFEYYDFVSQEETNVEYAHINVGKEV